MLVHQKPEIPELKQPAAAALPRLAARTSILYVALYLHYGFFLLIPLWLATQGATPSEIGTLMAIPLVLRLVTVAPFANWVGQRLWVRGAIALTAIMAAVLLGFLGLTGSKWERFLVVVIFAIVWDQLPVLVDAYASMAVRAQSLDFGRLRVWGSIGVVISTAVAGWAVENIGITPLPYLIAGLLLLVPAVAMTLPGDAALVELQAAEGGSWRSLFRDRVLIGAMVAASCIMGSHGVVNSFGAIQWTAQGISATHVGLLNTVAVASEIVIFAIGGRLLGERDPRLLIGLAALAGALRWAIMSIEPALPVLYLAQSLQGLTSTGPLLAPMIMISQRVPAQLSASAQGLNAVLIGAVLAAVTAASGWIWSAGPSLAFQAMIAVALLPLPVLVVQSRMERAHEN